MSDKGCDLEYPERFFAATQFTLNPPPHLAEHMSPTSKLLLHALYQQATHGPNTTPKPWGWPVNSSDALTAWVAWSDLGDMPKAEAREVYVATVEEDFPRWWEILTGQCNPEKVKEVSLQAAFSALQMVSECDDECEMLTVHDEMDELAKQIVDGQVKEKEVKEAIKQVENITRTPELFKDHPVAKDSWVPIEPNGAASTVPLPRQTHTSTVMKGMMYVVGGSYGGRALNDVQVLNLSTTSWSRLVIKKGNMPSITGHKAVVWNNKILICGGSIKNAETSTMSIYILDPFGAEGPSITLMDTYGIPPPACSFHGVTVIRSRLYVFGGEEMDDGPNQRRRPLGDIYVLDLDSKEWNQPATTGEAPCPRFGHVMDGFNDSIFVFGGSTTGQDYMNDLYILNLAHGSWSKPTCQGAIPPPVQGMTMCLIQRNSGSWAVTGGFTVTGNALFVDVYVLATSFGQSLTWTKIDGGKLLCGGEGTSIAVAHNEDEDQPSYLITYGGYSGVYSKYACAMSIGPRVAAAANPSSAVASFNALNAVIQNSAPSLADPPVTVPRVSEPSKDVSAPAGSDVKKEEDDFEKVTVEEANEAKAAEVNVEQTADQTPSSEEVKKPETGEKERVAETVPEKVVEWERKVEEQKEEVKVAIGVGAEGGAKVAVEVAAVSAAPAPEVKNTTSPPPDVAKAAPAAPAAATGDSMSDLIQDMVGGEINNSRTVDSNKSANKAADVFSSDNKDDLPQRAGEAAKEAVREAAVLAAKESARISARSAAAPGQAAASAVSSAVDAAAEMAFKQMLYAARISEQRLKECAQRIDTLEETKKLLTDEISSLNQKNAVNEKQFEMEMSTIKATLELKLEAQKANYEKLLTESVEREKRTTVEEHVKYDKLEMQKEVAVKDAARMQAEYKHELERLQAENFKLQSALKNMQDLEARVARLTEKQHQEAQNEDTTDAILNKVAHLIEARSGVKEQQSDS
mmetsp:Transcript_19803/g.23761  ORF Transcript_19803/g.23761 Transcript_19803/m.23761 type:complete len:971 (+) Transcript_19803:114-3026(+)